MIFNEIYSVYYNAVARIITAVLEGEADEKSLNRIVADTAFGESVLTVLPSLKSEKWQLVRSDMSTPIKHPPTMPLTTIQKRWLKAITLDKRIQLFGVSLQGLEDTKPLFTPDDYVVYDKYGDGDPFTDEVYIRHFKTTLSAIKENSALKISMQTRRGNVVSFTAKPVRLEYSEKDDKFRLINAGCRYGSTVNLARIISCEKCPAQDNAEWQAPPIRTKALTLRVRDERNALERCLLHFAHFEKQAERDGKNSYLVHINYDVSDETELVIRILGFGPLVEVVSPTDVRAQIAQRLKKQMQFGLESILTKKSKRFSASIFIYRKCKFFLFAAFFP